MQRDEYGRYPDLAEPDAGVQSKVAPPGALAPTPPPLASFQGLSEQDNVATVGGAIVPPDVNGDIGLDAAGNKIYVQYINLIWAVYSETGTLLAGPFAGNSFWSDFGGFCQANNDGDPVVLYDDLAGRWFFSQFSIGEGVQCVAISTTSDPLGPYHRYAFTVTPGGQNDYPKLGVWTDGAGQSAYTFTLRDFGGAGGSFSVSAGVMERDAMLVGAPAQFTKFINPCVGGNCIEGQLPPHLAGNPPPAGTCPTFWTAVDAAYDDSPFANDGYRNHTLCVDWANLSNSTYTEGPLVVAGSNFDRFLGNGFSDCIDQTGGEVLDCLAAFTMFRAQYRWNGDHSTVVFNTTVDAGGDRAGIRWAQTRSADGDSGWFLQQDGTYAPADGKERWMGSIAQDKNGNIALGYSLTPGDNGVPSVRYTSRMAGDALGTMPGGEVSCHEGTGAQIGSANRWGDYSSMSVDPVDDCTFWYTQEYYETTGSFDFNTRICSFQLAGCGAPECTVDADCDNGLFCDGLETCNEGTCEAGTPVVCDDGLFCNGTDTCNEATDECDVGAPPVCDDGAFCNGLETCNEGTDSCDPGTPVECPDNGVFCDGAEFCNEVSDICDSAGDPCPDICDEGNDVCIGCGDGVCDPGEDCDTCPSDCESGTLPGAVCGNGICEAGNGEDCVSCPADCNGTQTGRPSNRFCCGDGGGQNPVPCSDAQCSSGGFSCTDVPAPSGEYCCGDAFCEGPEDSFSCEVDCGAPPECGNGILEAGEDCEPALPLGESCESLGFESGILSCSESCAFDTSLCVEFSCGAKGDSCTVNSDCCSNACKRNGTCR
jgi:hypothetical protein